MAYTTPNLNNALTQCHYDPQARGYIAQEMSRVINMYPTLSPKPVQINANNNFYFILELNGTIPVLFQNVTYHIPIKIQFPIGYPNYAPNLIVNPAADMVIKASEYVTNDGRATLEILRVWNIRCTTQHLIEEAKKCFSQKMPVYKRSKNAPPPSIPQGYPNLMQNSYSNNYSIPPQPGYNQGPNLNNYMGPPQNYPPPNYNNNIIPPVVEKPRVTPEDMKKIGEVYEKTMTELKAEIALLRSETENLKKKSTEIDTAISSFKENVEMGNASTELLRASIQNTKEWIQTCNNGNSSELLEDELIEYRNIFARDYLYLCSEEKTIESTIHHITDAINKSLIPTKDAFWTIKQQFTALFMVSRLKEKAEKLAKSIN